MPELPEVECVRRGLQRAQLTRPIAALWRSELALRTGATWRRENLDAIRSATGRRWHRRGKFLIWELARGDATMGMIVHLGMTGRLVVEPNDAPLLPHTHLRVSFGDGRQLRYVDARRFGGLHVDRLDALWGRAPLGELGPEPLARGFDGGALAAKAGRSQRSLHDVLLDQRVVAGVGNIYAQEALFVAGLHPLAAARRLRPSAWTRLADAVTEVLRQGVRNGGTSFRDYRNAAGRRGRNQDALWVYGRAGEACRRCGAELRRYERSGRRGAWCPEDQPRPRGRID
jgi:formamidopyrimidine-DNA glycosylase